MKTIWITVLVLVVAGGGLWWLLAGGDDGQSGDSSTALVCPDDTTAEVKYTDRGFEPNSVTISKGDTVCWLNQSTQGMHVASNDHPVHDDYPGFDQLGSGGVYSFTFDKTGTWGYHNHLNHTVMGTVIVN